VETISHAHQQKSSELEQAREDWKNLEEMMKNINNELVGTKSAALDTLKLADTIANNQQAQSDALVTDSLNSRICDLNEQVEHLTLKNSELELASRDLVERHKLGMLVAIYRSLNRPSCLPTL
jgi:chaperonin cofactor prefoldin